MGAVRKIYGPRKIYCCPLCDYECLSIDVIVYHVDTKHMEAIEGKYKKVCRAIVQSVRTLPEGQSALVGCEASDEASLGLRD